MPVVADTSFLIDLVGRERDAMELAEELAEQGLTIVVPTVVLAEYAVGFANPEAAARELAAGAEIVPFSVGHALTAAALGRRLAAEGKFPGWNDLFIAAVAADLGGLRIVTRNPKHFPLSETMAY